MTLDQLIEAAQNPTPELIEEVSKRVWEALGNCVHVGIKGEVRVKGKHGIVNIYPYHCRKCDKPLGYVGRGQWEIKPFQIPDITKPENFWPLVVEKRLIIIPESASNPEFPTYKAWHISIHEASWSITNKNPGLAVCLAYLKIKEQENER